MRPPVLLLAASLLAACGRGDRGPASEPGAGTVASRGPDPVLLRVPRGGGRVTAAIYPRLDSVVWRSGEAAPALARVLAFDGESGVLAVVDTAGRPARIDLRLGSVASAARAPYTALASADGAAIFGLAADGSVARLTTTGDPWTRKLPGEVQELFPQRDGSVLAAGTRGGAGYVWRLRPPTTRVSDSASVPGASRALRPGGAADRVYFGGADVLVGVRARDLQPLRAVPLGGPLRAVAATPSGDRIFVALAGRGAVEVVDRFRDAVAATIELPSEVHELRVDPLGRYVLARPARGDSAWVIAVGDGRVLGAVATAWRGDLPLVLPDGAIAAATGDDVTLHDGATLRARSTVAGGAADFWHVVLWNGFRPRAEGLDAPVTFENRGGRDSVPADTVPTDSAAPAPIDTAFPEPTPPPDTAAPRPPRPTVPSPGEVALHAGDSYTVQFAAAPSEGEARRLVRRSRAPRAPRVVPATRAGRTVYRVVTGPFAARAEAERVARASGMDFWIYEGMP
ncbi:SPOR domain-containing protein [Roseisolibacter sp. H3M3-2]|uniref:SPOR domain-containing protein n=1 Tax=Roseisolibacter sp. H3M3-2 TaxID=3031323 RepID=UPI0023D9FCC2|nr:SPOR domain-containing protein [Roseisolibacter sp. H3M3-2]MDF1505716.1 SPOR domain-containing protein [Roseisolibacter sp. H3M3-2]